MQFRYVLIIVRQDVVPTRDSFFVAATRRFYIGIVPTLVLFRRGRHFICSVNSSCHWSYSVSVRSWPATTLSFLQKTRH